MPEEVRTFIRVPRAMWGRQRRRRRRMGMPRCSKFRSNISAHALPQLCQIQPRSLQLVAYIKAHLQPDQILTPLHRMMEQLVSWMSSMMDCACCHSWRWRIVRRAPMEVEDSSKSSIHAMPESLRLKQQGGGGDVVWDAQVEF